MRRYRIVKRWHWQCGVCYQPQVRWLWWWRDLGISYSTVESAERRIAAHATPIVKEWAA